VILYSTSPHLIPLLSVFPLLSSAFHLVLFLSLVHRFILHPSIHPSIHRHLSIISSCIHTPTPLYSVYDVFRYLFSLSHAQAALHHRRACIWKNRSGLDALSVLHHMYFLRSIHTNIRFSCTYIHTVSESFYDILRRKLYFYDNIL